MSIGIHYANTGLVRQNHTVINAVNKSDVVSGERVKSGVNRNDESCLGGGIRDYT